MGNIGLFLDPLAGIPTFTFLSYIVHFVLVPIVLWRIAMAKTRVHKKRCDERVVSKPTREDHIYVAWLEVTVGGKRKLVPGLAHASSARAAESAMFQQQEFLHTRDEHLRKLQEGEDFTPRPIEDIKVLHRTRATGKNGDLHMVTSQFKSQIDNVGVMNQGICALLSLGSVFGKLLLRRDWRNRKRRLARR